MAGNTRGKLKEHFEGIHRNLDWSLHHVNASLSLIDSTLRTTDGVIALGDDNEAIVKFIEDYPLFKGIKALGDGISTLDELANNIYVKL